MKLDEVDRGIIGHLRQNSRMTFVEIGRNLGVSDATVYNRIKRMITDGVIKRFTVEVDEAAIEERISGFMLVNVKPGAMIDVSKNIAEIEKVSEVHEVHGQEDLVVKIRAKSLRKLRSVILEVRGISNVVQTEFLPIFRTWKD